MPEVGAGEVLSPLAEFEPPGGTIGTSGVTRLRQDSTSSIAADRTPLLLAGLAVLLAVGVVLASGVGAIPLPLDRLGDLITGRLAGTTLATVLWEVRLPRILLAVVAGAALASSGVAWQGLLRNPLADPYLIGVAAGGALGAGVAITFGFSGAWVPPSALLGALFAASLVMGIARWAAMRAQGVVDGSALLLLAGVAVSSLFSAALSLVMVLHDQGLTSLYFWLLGGFSGRGWAELGAVAPYLVAGGALLLWRLRALNLLQLGDDAARALGVEVTAARRALVLAGTLLAAAVVSECGAIGFVGLIVPHLARMAVGADLRKSVGVAALLGAILLLLADTAARALWAPQEVPVGVITALLGAPFFLYLLVRRS